MSEAVAGSMHDPEHLVLEYLNDPRPDLKDVIILQYSNMVERIARRFSGVEPLDDLVQVGYIGLLNALSKFDPEAGVRFNTYATHLVAGEIKHYLRDRAQIIRHPAWVQELRQRLNRATITLQADLGRTPTEREIADACKVSEQAVREVMATQELLRVTSLDAPIQEDDESDTDIDKLESAESSSGQVSVEDRVVLEDAMRQLRDLEREVLILFHFESLNQTEIASKLDISCNYVSHILRQSLNKLRRILNSEEEADRSLRKDYPETGQVIDLMTRAYTEGYFSGRLTEEIHRSTGSGSGVAIVTVEFTGLEAMQRFYGDSSVTDFLADAAEFLRSSVRTLDVVCRIGKTGFGIILPETTANAILVRHRLERRFEQWLVGRATAAGSLQVKLGHASSPDDGRSAKSLLEAADQSVSDCRQAA